MIHYFGTGEEVSVVFQEKYLTAAEKAQAILVVEEEIPAEEKEGFYAMRYIDPKTKKFSWIYKEIIKEEE
jgi:hypothetical protein